MTHPRHPSPLILCGAFLGLMVLLVATVIFAQMHLGVWNTPIGLLISVIKTLLIIVLFMNLLNASGAIRLVSISAILWLGIAITSVVADYRTRGWDETPEQSLATGVHIETYDRVEFQPESHSPTPAENE